MENIVDKIFTTVKAGTLKPISDRHAKNLSGENLSDIVPDKKESVSSGSKEAKVESTVKNRVKHSTNEEDELVVQVIRDKTGKIIRTIPLNEQHAVDIFE